MSQRGRCGRGTWCDSLARYFGLAWEDAQLAHFHAENHNCIFVAIAVLNKNEESATIAMRIVEVNEDGQFIVPSPVKESGEGHE